MKKLDLTKTLDEFFFEYIDGKQYLKFTSNFLKDEIKDELFKIICTDISNDISIPIHKNSEFYYTEIIREIKFVNLYELEDNYTQGTIRDSRLIHQLYKKMSEDKIGGFKFYPKGRYANERLNQACFIEMDIKDRVDAEIEDRKNDKDSNYVHLVDEEEIRYIIEEEYLDTEDYKSEEIIISLDSDEYKPLTKRDKERLKQRKKRALQKRAKGKSFHYEKKAEEYKKSMTNLHSCNIKISNKATD